MKYKKKKRGRLTMSHSGKELHSRRYEGHTLEWNRGGRSGEGKQSIERPIEGKDGGEGGLGSSTDSTSICRKGRRKSQGGIWELEQESNECSRVATLTGGGAGNLEKSV